MVAKAEARRMAQMDRIKRVARQTLGLARDLRALNAVNRRIFVLDDRHTQNDLGWLVRIANAEYATHVNPNLETAALDEKKAREKVATRYPSQKGFHVLSIETHEA